MDAPADFGSQQKDIQKSLVSVVKTVNRLAAEDLPFLRTVNPDTARQLDENVSRTLGLSTRLLQAAARACNSKAPKLEDAEDIDMRWQSIVDIVDSVLEKADTALDEYTGLIKRNEPPSTQQTTAVGISTSTAKVIRKAAVDKPQLLFERKPDNFPSGPWKPIITSKPHATVPLDESLVLVLREDGTLQYRHPYEAEITDMKYPDRLFNEAEPIPPQPAESTSATWVDTYEGVLGMLQELKKASEIAVDLEHHDFRTYNGLVCLMQISTREKDWIVDTLQPWRHKLEVLNEVFADPKIVKVFHGAYMDMIWLQRDLGLYVNCLFDTYFACVLLNFPGRSLAFLLSKYVNFDADKQYQLADWRIRPIPPDMLYYARSDTHYLLYIYDHLRNELVSQSNREDPERDLIGNALQRSRELALSRHEHPECDKETGNGSRGWLGYSLKQAHHGFDGEQFAVFRALWQWRDKVAREEDENPNFVIGNQGLISIARVKPPDAKALYSLLPFAASLARARLSEMWERTREAKAQGGPSMVQHFESLRRDSPAAAPRSQATAKPTSGDGVGLVRLKKSQLFGDMAVSTRWEAGGKDPKGMNDPFPFPWQRFVDGLGGGEKEMEDEKVTAQSGGADATVKAAPVEGTAEEAVDEEFTLGRKRGKKRKSKAVEEDEEEEEEEEDEGGGRGGGEDEEPKSESDGASGDADEDDGVLSVGEGKERRPRTPKKTKSERKKERRERKEREREERRRARKAKKQKREGGEEEDEPAFDYSKADSVLHAAGRGGSTATKVFDPYTKTADDGLKGARKAPPVRGERSATFKG
ncbi:hypothetical protein CP532_2251 [Ophiocordyceps camponoti-leonardi (nom. inval.)]|nr:hypothetical protein CP532_2251 [Ophiocordyceps camponoti-leonardi (nom. inval.)]